MRTFLVLGFMMLSMRVVAQTATSGLPAVKSAIPFGMQDSVSSKGQELLLETFEYNTVSYTKDSDDAGFMDFTISQRYPLKFVEALYPLIIRYTAKQTDSIAYYNPRLSPYFFSLHFAFTGRFAQYIGSRESGPVIGKRFNPYLFVEFVHPNRPNNRYRFGYGHESNGQSINDSTTFFTTVNESEGKLNETLDHISRGWDYWGGSASFSFPFETEKIAFFTDLSLRYYLKNGLSQGAKEEYRSWEADWYGKYLKRNDVSGISLGFELILDESFINRIRVSTETGIASPLKYNSVRAQVSISQTKFPLYFSYANGFNGDLAQFGKRNSSFSIGLLFSTFNFPLLVKSEREAVEYRDKNKKRK